ncbi:Cytochrome c [Gimesia panareensis]|uniref:Cytochrome c n=1 Tax=Gimesia panareensis TaxID=2527978 RepID=A0A517Q4A2_9PLAN|nr:c-type cytochrome [Gimesia panareensis]QDT26473.1 Cytochrome c [Gimesia panareensis]
MQRRWLTVPVLGLLTVFLLTTLPAEQSTEVTQKPLIPEAYPPGELGEIVKLGQELVARTHEHPLSKQYVGNALDCTSCHLKNGTDARAASFLGVAAAYPAWSPREKRVITLEDRVLNCFMRSQNGIRPPLGSKVSVAITAYITWLSSGSEIRMNHQKPLGPRHVPSLSRKAELAEEKRGAKLYEDRCADCHGASGAGTTEGPPVWGKQSYNDGAGLSRNDKLSAWLKVSMPPDDTDLTEQEALDIAAYVNSHPRPHFILKEHLPPAERLGVYDW